MNELREQLIQSLNDMEVEIRDSKDPQQLIYERVDSTIPVYHYDILEVALSETTLATYVPEIFAFNGEHTAVNAIAGNIYSELLETGNKWLEEKNIPIV